MRAIQKMEEWLEEKREEARAATKRGQVLAFAHAADKARRLAALEKEQGVDKGEQCLRDRLVKIRNYAATCMECRDEPEFTMFCEIAGELSALLQDLGPTKEAKGENK